MYLKCAFVIKGFATRVAAHTTLARGGSHAAHAMHFGGKGSMSDGFRGLVLYKVVVDLVVAQAVGLLRLILGLLLALLLLLLELCLLLLLLLSLLSGRCG